MLTRNTVNFILDLVSLLDLLGLVFTGCIVRYVLPAGTGGLGQIAHEGSGRGINVEKFWSMTRHEWGGIHFYLAAAFTVLMIMHIILHWKWIKCYAKSFFNKQS